MCLTVYKGTKWKFTWLPKTVYKIVRLGNTNETIESLVLGFKYKFNKTYKVSISEIKAKAVSEELACVSYSVGFHYYFDKRSTSNLAKDYYPNIPVVVKCKIPAFSWYLTDDIYQGISNKIKIVKIIK